MSTTPYSETVPPGFALHRITTPAGRVALWGRGGREPALVLVHGNTSSKSAFRELLCEPALAQYRTIAIDLPGAGESGDAENPALDYTIPAMARTVMAVLFAAGLDHAVILGWSLGGHLAIEAAGQGANFRAIILTGTPPCGPGVDEVMSVFHPSDLMAVTAGETPPPELLDAYVHALYGKSKTIPAEFFAAARRFDGRMRRIFSEHFMTTAEAAPQRRLVAEWPHPIAVIEGDEEPFFDPKGLDDLTWKNLWRGKCQPIAGAGHAPFFEQPKTYAALVADFLASLDR